MALLLAMSAEGVVEAAVAGSEGSGHDHSEEKGCGVGDEMHVERGF